MVQFANPIYDVVFKYLMEDERVAKILLSALLKKKVTELQVRRNEYTNVIDRKISMFRIDFAATVVDADGTERHILIELQKTWLPTETLRFRQYLGSQYMEKENVPLKNNPKGFGLPIVSIYILGHKVGDLQEPVIYVRRHYLDYDNRLIQKGVPDPFIESLTHDSIIVQIPYLPAKASNHLEKLLVVFDQRYKVDGSNEHLLQLDDSHMDGDEQLLVNRLIRAAASPDMRRGMQIEDEFLSELERLDTQIMVKEKEIEEKDKKLEDQGKKLEEKDKKLEEQNKKLEERGKKLEEQNKKLEEQNKELEERDKKLEEQTDVIQSLLQTSVQALSSQGFSAEEIARMLNLPMEEITRIQALFL